MYINSNFISEPFSLHGFAKTKDAYIKEDKDDGNELKFRKGKTGDIANSIENKFNSITNWIKELNLPTL